MSSVSSDSVVLSWRPPEVAGPCDVVQYVIAKRDPGEIWRDIRPNLMRYLGFTDEVLSYKVSCLQAAKEYQFAVRARNDIGDSKFLESQSVIRTKNLGKFSRISISRTRSLRSSKHLSESENTF